MQVEDVTGVRLAARGTTQQQRELPVGLGLLGQVVVHHEGVLAVLHPVLAHGATGVGSEVLERRGVGGRSRHDDRVLERTGLTEGLDGLRDGGALLADRHVNALHTLSLLVQDGVDRDRGLAGLAVTDDELALTAADRGHRVDGLDAGLERLVHRLAAHDAGRLDLHAPQLRADKLAAAIDGLTEGVDDASEDAVTDRDREDPTGRLDRLPLLDLVALAEDDRADGRLVEVEGETDRAVLELEELVHGGVGETGDAGDAVADLDYAADGAGLERGLVALKVLRDRLGDIGCGDREFSHGLLLETALQLVDAGADAPVDDGVADGGHETTDDGGIDDDLEVHLVARRVREGGTEACLLVVAQGDGASDLGDRQVLRLGGAGDEAVDDRREVAAAARADHHRDELDGGRGGLSAEQ